MAQYLGRVIKAGIKNKTVKVEVQKLELHPLILKYWNEKYYYNAHDEHNECADGDYVLIKEMNAKDVKHKTKTFNLLKIVEKAPRLSDFEPTPSNEDKERDYPS